MSAREPERNLPLDTIRTVDVVIRGRVQGVGYRYWTSHEAERRGLNGHVRNRADGSVEARFSGPSDAVAAMIEACRLGPAGAVVSSVEAVEAAHPPDAGFRILRA
ncbi:acylphosphatase [Methylobacterium sp. W2]|uniref:acylphosphatase n=1 Tax=Methylobacterium sp. W2 TaxID=2598107 RepID=UPI001D0C538E|nr:acylphosphatase [Methylobacterium sp. W2]